MNTLFSILGLNFTSIVNFLKELPEASRYAIRK